MRILLLIVLAQIAMSPLPGPARELAGLSPPTHRVQVLADTRVEDPPVYSGANTVPLPGPGERVELQIFMPEVAGLLAYGAIVEFDDGDSAFSDSFRIEEAYTWAVANVRDASGRRQVRRRIDMPAPIGSSGPGRSILYTSPPSIPDSGLLATVVLTVTNTPPPRRPLRFTASAAVYATTPPSRIWHFRSDQAIFWR